MKKLKLGKMEIKTLSEKEMGGVLGGFNPEVNRARASVSSSVSASLTLTATSQEVDSEVESEYEKEGN